MDISNVCPTEDAIKVFLELLVSPLLPKSNRETPKQDKQEEVARQVHAVVLLYSHFLWKRHPHLEYLDFEAFCKLAVILKPNLKSYINLMPKTNDTESGVLDKELSSTEKAIKDAFDISTGLGALINVPSAKEWPVTKVAILLVNPTKENCILLHSSITRGVKSLIEKDVNESESLCSPDGSIEAKHMSKRKRIPNKHSQDKLEGDECRFRKVAIEAVKEATKDGIKESDLTIIETHNVYSLSKVKEATRFYIMQCAQAAKSRWIPIKDVFESLQGPLLQKTSSGWMHTSVVEYFHLLPYAQIIYQWFSRYVHPIEEPESVQEVVNRNDIKMTEEPFEPEVRNNRKRNFFDGGVAEVSRNSSCAESEKLNEQNEHCSNDFLYPIDDGSWNMDVDNHYLVQFEKSSTPKNVAGRVQHSSQLKKTNSHEVHNLNGKTDVYKLEVVNPTVQNLNNLKDQIFANRKASSSNMPYQNGIPSENRTPVIHESNSHFDDVIALKEPGLSEAALRVLRTKRNKLVLQYRSIGDEIAQYDKDMQTILNGGKGASGLKIDLLIEGCNDACRESTNQGRTSKDYEEPCSIQCKKRNRIAEEAYSKQNTCQELDGICQNKNWLLPTYEVFPLDGGFQAKVTVKGTDFESSSVGDACPVPHEARGSAASKMLAKLLDHV